MEKKPRPKMKNRKAPYEGKTHPAQAGKVAGTYGKILDEEIDALRASAHRMLEHAEGVDDPLDAVKALTAFGAQVARIASLMRTQARLTGNSRYDEVADTIRRAVAEAAKDWSL